MAATTTQSSAPASTGAPAPAAAGAYTSASLYVGDLSPEVSEGTLFDTFSQIGTVASIRVCRDAVTRRSLGYAYVNFHAAEDARTALEELNSSLINGRPCRVMWSQRDPTMRKTGAGNIFIKNLAPEIDHRTLYDSFAAFGQILSCKVVMDEAGESKGYGFVHFDSEESAKKAIEGANGLELVGKKIHVAAFVPKKDRQSSSTTNFTNLYTKSLPADIKTTEDLENMFKPYGTITSVHLAVDKATSEPKGFGFVNFEKPEDAKAAVEALNGKEVEPAQGDEDAKVLYVGRAQKKAEREAELRQKMEALRAERQSKYQGVNLYVKNLEDTVTDEQLRKLFEQYGTITSCKVMVDDKGNSRGFGFVCFSNSEEATNAVTELNNHMIDNKPLYVAVAQRRDVRRAQLEQEHARRVQKNMPGQMMPGQPGMGFPGPMFYGPAGAQGMPPQQAAMMYQNMMPAAGRRGAPVPGAWAAPGAAGAFPVNGNYVMPAGFNMQQMQQQQAAAAAAGRGAGRGAAAAGRGGRGGAAGRGAGRGGVEAMVNQPLDVAAILQLSPEQQKLVVGEKLYPLIAATQPELAGKITGMLLDSYFTEELCHLMNNRESLNAKITEAINVLKEHQSKGGQ